MTAVQTPSKRSALWTGSMGSSRRVGAHRVLPSTAALALLALATHASHAVAAEPVPPCDKPVYLTLDTGHMGVASLIADVLKRQQVRATFFAANEKTEAGSGSLSPSWQVWWEVRGKEGHEFASHTLDHTYWLKDLPGKPPRYVVRPSQGAFAGRTFTWEEDKYCEALDLASHRLKLYTGKDPLPLFRAPGGKTSPSLLKTAESCGYKHVGWSPAGFLGDELPSDKYPNDALLKKATRDIKAGDILLAHLGIWSRKDPWAPAVLEPLIVDLKARGFCFATLREHPNYRPWLRQKGF